MRPVSGKAAKAVAEAVIRSYVNVAASLDVPEGVAVEVRHQFLLPRPVRRHGHLHADTVTWEQQGQPGETNTHSDPVAVHPLTSDLRTSGGLSCMDLIWVEGFFLRVLSRVLPSEACVCVKM